MEKTPKSLRLQIGLFGRTNVGKSSFLNLAAGQDVAITSPVAGTMSLNGESDPSGLIGNTATPGPLPMTM